MPFIGKFYGDADVKIVVVGESHFLDGNNLNRKAPEFTKESWYDLNANDLPKKEQEGDNFIGAIYTREVIEDFIYRSKGRSYTIYKNLASVMDKQLPYWPGKKNTVFENVVFLNYFQRPSFRPSKAIINSKKDNEVAFNVFIGVIKVVKPDVIFVASIEAFKAFSSELTKYPDEKLPQIHPLPHPGGSSPYWTSKKSKEYQVHEDGKARTGKEKFADYLKHYMQIQS